MSLHDARTKRAGLGERDQAEAAAKPKVQTSPRETYPARTRTPTQRMGSFHRRESGFSNPRKDAATYSQKTRPD